MGEFVDVGVSTGLSLSNVMDPLFYWHILNNVKMRRRQRRRETVFSIVDSLTGMHSLSSTPFVLEFETVITYRD